MTDFFDPKIGESKELLTARIVSNTKQTDKDGKSSNVRKTVVAYLPDTISMGLTAEWSAPFGGGGGGALDNVLSLMGMSMKTQPLSAQVWGGTAPMEITLPLTFVANSNIRKDVIEPCLKLMQMVLPSLSNGSSGQFSPPGPSFAEYAAEALKNSDVELLKKIGNSAAANGVKTGETIDIYLGNFFVIKKVVVTGVTPTFSTNQLGRTGEPLKVTVDFSFRSYTALTKADLGSMFQPINVAERN